VGMFRRHENGVFVAGAGRGSVTFGSANITA